ncbi:MAG: ribosome maturation factor RimM [Geoalkalibacter sp.]|uniref:ribosome maturation factor RimM n=1 Tax=Geoalkalibacter sp. TaxID=3041440 RepID=UPI003D0AF867
MSRSGSSLFKVGVVTGTHGLRGDLKVRTLTSGSDSLSHARFVELRPGAGGSAQRFTPARATPHKNVILLRLQGREDINAVQEWIGAEVWMDRADLPELDADESYWFELEGLRVVDATLGEIGVLEEMFSTPAHDIYVVRGPFGEVLVPVVEEFIKAVDLDEALLQVDLPQGLVNLDEQRDPV